MRAILLVGPMLLQAALAQAPTASWGTRTIQLKYANADDLRRVFSGQSYVIEANRDLNLLTAKGPQNFLNEVEETVKRFDVSPPVPANIQITVYLVAVGPAPPGGLPPELAGIARELKTVFGARAYRVSDNQVIRVRAGQPGEAASLAPPADGMATLSRIRLQRASLISGPNGNVISLDGLRVGLNLPGNPAAYRVQPAESGIAADIDVGENKAVIVGKAGTDKPLVVLVRAKIAT